MGEVVDRTKGTAFEDGGAAERIAACAHAIEPALARHVARVDRAEMIRRAEQGTRAEAEAQRSSFVVCVRGRP